MSTECSSNHKVKSRVFPFLRHTFSTFCSNVTSHMSRNPAPGQAAPQWRTILELFAIAVAIYAFVGAPGVGNPFSTRSGSSESIEPAKSLARIESLVYPDSSLDCSTYDHGYEVHVLSTRPLVVYIGGFLSDEEADELIELRYALDSALSQAVSCPLLSLYCSVLFRLTNVLAWAPGKVLPCSTLGTKPSTAASANPRKPS